LSLVAVVAVEQEIGPVVEVLAVFYMDLPIH
jgi:hypothetical protein